MAIEHELHGNGPVRVIMLHDWSSDCAGDYSMVRPLLNTEKLTVAFADLRGYGRSKAIEGVYTVDEVSADVAELADALGWDSFAVGGHSMTGMAVQRIMLDMPGRVRKVVAAVPIPASGFPLDEATFGFFESMATDDAAFRQGMHALTSSRYGSEWVDYKLAMNRAAVSAPAMKTFTSMWSKTDFAADAEGCETPILVLFGAHDHEALRETANGALFRGWYPNATIHVCASGHYPMQECTVEYTHVVQEYLLAD